MKGRPTDWRSLLLLAADDHRRLARAPEKKADLLVLDLEDAVAPAAKAAARQGLPAVYQELVRSNQDFAVRINASWRDAVADLEAAVMSGLKALMVPKVEDAAPLAILSAMIGEWEEERRLPAGAIGLIALIESPAGLIRLPEIASTDRLIGLALGTEDFCASLGVAPTSDSLDLPTRLITLAAAARGLSSFAIPYSIADYTGLDELRRAAAMARAYGATGALTIHPAQVRVINEVFAPSTDDIADARLIIQAWDEAGQPPVMSYDGKMIDRPVILRVRRMLGVA